MRRRLIPRIAACVRSFALILERLFGRPPASLTRDAREALLRHDWSGNIRELRNALERAAIRCDGLLIGADRLALSAGGSQGRHSRVPG